MTAGIPSLSSENTPPGDPISPPAVGAAARLLAFAGIDRPVAHALLGQGWTMLAGPVSLVLIATRLSAEEQGYLYTFNSLAALSVFFELGLSYVLMQVAAHEAAHLVWTAEGTIAGDAVQVDRLSALYRSGARWYAVSAVLMAVLVLPAGALFFARAQGPTAVNWMLPWTLAVIAVAANLALTPRLAVLEGAGRVAEVTFVRAAGNVVKFTAFWVALVLNLRLFSTFAFHAALFLWSAAWLASRARRFFAALTARPHGHGFDWRRDVWPFQWKIAVSWLSGYLIFQLFTPVLFAYQGAVVAGQMGMSLNVTGAILTAGMAWVQTKGSPFGQLVAKRRFQDLDRLFFRTALQSFAAVALGETAFWIAVSVLRHFRQPFTGRVLPLAPLALLAGTAVLNQVIFSIALYLRAHRQEPLLWPSAAGALIGGVSTYVLGRCCGAEAITIANFVLTSSGLAIAVVVFRAKRRQWHSVP